jgi:ribose transport system substrate-binding protein
MDSDPARRRPGRRIVSAAVLATAALIASACSSSAGGAPPAGKTAAAGIATAQQAAQQAVADPASINQTIALKTKPPAGKSVIFVTEGLPATERIAVGVHEAANALGWSYSEVSFDASNPASLQSALLSALDKKPAAVFEAGSPQSLFGASTIAAYKAANVPIILGSVAPVELGAPIYGTPAGAASEQVVGKRLADWFIADSSGTGKALLENYTSAPVLNVFRDAFIAEVKASCPGCSTKVVGVTQSDVASGDVISKVVAAARSNPSYTYIFFDNGEFADGIVPALSAAGLSGLKIGGRSIDPAGAATLKAGTEQVWTGQSYYLEGEAMMDEALRVLLGQPGAQNDDLVPVQLITKNNIAKVPSPYNLPSDSLQQYEKLWGVPQTPCKLTCS